MTVDQLKTLITEKIETAKGDCEESRTSPNSYGAGYDSGYLQALLDIEDIVNTGVAE